MVHARIFKHKLGGHDVVADFDVFKLACVDAPDVIPLFDCATSKCAVTRPNRTPDVPHPRLQCGIGCMISLNSLPLIHYSLVYAHHRLRFEAQLVRVGLDVHSKNHSVL